MIILPYLCLFLKRTLFFSFLVFQLLKWKAQAFFQVKQLEEADEVIEVVLKLESGSSGIKKPESTPNSYLLKANIDVALGRFV